MAEYVKKSDVIKIMEDNQMHILRTLPGVFHGVSGRSGRGNQKITKQRIKLESRYLPALFIAKFLKHVPQLFY